jgi:hypothetical protein
VMLRTQLEKKTLTKPKRKLVFLNTNCFFAISWFNRHTTKTKTQKQKMSDQKAVTLNLLPKQIIIVRHAEKERDDHDAEGASKKGLARANYVASLFLTPNPAFEKPDIIYAFQKKHNKEPLLNRSVQLALPLVNVGRYEVPVQFNTQFEDTPKETVKMIESVFAESNAQKVVLIIWEHAMIPHIVREIGARFQPHKPLFKDFKSWSLAPEKKKDDPELYSLILVLDSTLQTLTAYNQSNDFSKDDSMLFPDPHTYTKKLFAFS